MKTWQIVLIIVCGLIYLSVLIAEYNDYRLANKKGYKLHSSWGDICKAIFAPLYLVWIIFVEILEEYRDYQYKLKEHGGYKEYRKWKREIKLEEKRREKEHERIAKAYKNNEIRRDELPRCRDGIKKFELYGKILSDDWKELVYIENECNEVLNNFFELHPNIELKHGMKVVYLPQCIENISNDDILNYWNPSSNKATILANGLDTSVLLKEVCYPEDVSKFKHGFLSCCGWSYNHDAEFLNAIYYPLEEAEDEGILQQIEIIAKEVLDRNSGGLYCSIEETTEDKKPTKDFADDHFIIEINHLIDEIRERVEKLEQHGISRNILKKLLTEEQKLSRLVITKDMRIMLPDYNNMEIKLEPINKAVFLLFLRHPEGIIFKHLPDYRKELAEIYQKIKPLGLNERAIRSIEDVTNPFLNSINEKCARIRGAFVSQFDDSLARHYYIYGYRGEPKKIALPRDLVIWE